MAVEKDANTPLEALTFHETPTRHLRAGKMTLLDATKTAMRDALTYKGKLTQETLSMEGMSGRKYRYFINNLIANVAGARYLEVGSWSGSTLCSAIEGNDVTATAIDNWSLFGGPMNLFYQNLARCASATTRVSVLNNDFRKVDYRGLGRFNVYLFDGPHEYQDQYDGLAYALEALENEFVFIVDDWNWEPVRQGTLSAIADLGLTVVWAAEVRTTDDNSHPQVQRQHSDWHNGYYISILRK